MIFSTYRKSQGVSVGELSRESQVSNATIYAMEAGRPISLVTAGKIVRALNKILNTDFAVSDFEDINVQ